MDLHFPQSFKTSLNLGPGDVHMGVAVRPDEVGQPSVETDFLRRPRSRQLTNESVTIPQRRGHLVSFGNKTGPAGRKAAHARVPGSSAAAKSEAAYHQPGGTHLGRTQ